MKRLSVILCLLLTCLAVFCSCGTATDNKESVQQKEQSGVVTLDSIPEFDGETPFVAINDNEPLFTAAQMKSEPFEEYGELDSLGRCTTVFACISKELMPTEERGSIGQVKPSGWQTVKYDNVDGKYLYNRCHLIGFQLTGENANRQNLITGTRYMNVEGMLPFENMVADYIKETENRVLYRVTPIFEASELVARGVQIEAYSVEDDGEGICFNVYVYNNQPDIVIDYLTGESRYEKQSDKSEDTTSPVTDGTYVLNKSSKKFHKSECSGVKNIKPENKETFEGNREQIISNGYEPCGTCKP